MNYWLFLLPVISAFIGYITNLVAIKMLFHPKEPVQFLGIAFQGVFPKRQKMFAEKLGKLVSDELLSFDDISKAFTNEEDLNAVVPVLEAKVDDFLRHKLPSEMPMISMFIGDKTVNKMKEVLMAEVTSMLPEMMETYTHSIREKIDLESIVVEKVSGFSSDKLEEILYGIMANELRFVELIGGVLGFFIGLVQMAISMLTS